MMMCGIVGYLGTRPAIPLLIDSLKRLEYRGYDSSGLALMHEESHTYHILKAVGKLSNLDVEVNAQHDTLAPFLESSPERVLHQVGIGHIRWATHGAPTQANAHPHEGTFSRIVLVHNGIIENYAQLKTWILTQRPSTVFTSDTDTEVVAQLLELCLEQHPAGAEHAPFEEVFREALSKLHGAFALTVIDPREPDKLYIARQQAPLLIGVLEPPGEYLVASDTVAVAQHTNKVIFMENGQYGIVSTHGIQLKTLDGIAVKPEISTIQTGQLLIEKKGFKHYMLKEIYDQPDVVRQSLSGRLTSAEAPITLLDQDGTANTQAHSESFTRLLREAERVIILGCGSSYHAGLVGKYFIESLCRIPVEVESAGEFRYRTPVITPKTLVFAISQSGETADTLEAIRIVNRLGGQTAVITNREESSMTRECRFTLPVRAGVEVSVCATKSFVAQVVVLFLIGMALAEARIAVGLLDEANLPDSLASLKTGFLHIPAVMESMLTNLEGYKHIAKKYGNFKDMLFIGRGINYPVALEGALKLKEISYLHAEAYSGSELKHGPIALLDNTMPVLSVLAEGILFEKILSNCQEARARDARMVAITNVAEHPTYGQVFDDIIVVPQTLEALSPLIMSIPLQLISYYIAEYLGKDVDQPRNLAKSVTVE
ncbi:MAG: glutamine--fructose-6-phosphate transaminase (isomerizing) [Vampirovibrionales bacterium]